jgi:hypothetical protein
MIELLLAFAFWPWLLVALLASCLGVAAYSETTAVALIGLVLFGGVAWFLYGLNPFTWLYENPGSALIVSAMYCAFGVLWSLFKWRSRITSPDIQREMIEAKSRFNKEHPEAGPYDYMSNYLFPSRALASKNKDRITSWIALWPFSVVMYFLGEVLARFFERIYDLISGAYERVTRHYAP